MNTSENPTSKIKLKTWQILAIVLIGLGAIGQFSGGEPNNSDESLPDLTTKTSSAPISDTTWIPEGYNVYFGDDNLAWRWGSNSETECTYSSGSCWSVFVVSRDGCPSGLYGEIAIFDKSEVQIDYTNDTTTRVLPSTKVKLTFDTFNEQADTAQVAELNCR